MNEMIFYQTVIFIIGGLVGGLVAWVVSRSAVARECQRQAASETERVILQERLDVSGEQLNQKNERIQSLEFQLDEKNRGNNHCP